MISGRRARCRPPPPRHCSTCSTRRPARPRPGLASRHRRASGRPLGRGTQKRVLGGRDDGGRTGVGVHGPSGTRSGDECETPSTAKRSLSAASPRKCSPRTAGAWAAPLAAGEPQASRRGARRPPARGRCLLRPADRGVGSIWPCIVRNASSVVSRSRRRSGHRQHDRERWIESNPRRILQDGTLVRGSAAFGRPRGPRSAGDSIRGVRGSAGPRESAEG